MKLFLLPKCRRLLGRRGMTQESLIVIQRVIRALTAHLAIVDETGLIIGVNPAWRNFGDANGLRYPFHGLGANYLQVCDAARGQSAAEAANVAANIRRLLNEKRGTFVCEYSCHSQTEQRWFTLVADCFEHNSRCYMVLAHQNVTATKHAEQAMEASLIARTARAGLEDQVADRTSRLQESLKVMEGFLYHVGHNLRAPLRATHGFSRLLLERHASGLDGLGLNLLRRILEASETMDALINRLLAFGRLELEQPKCTAIDLAGLAEEVSNILARERERKRAEVMIEKPMPQAWGDRTLLRLVLCELVANAIKFVPAGRSPRVFIRAEYRDDKVRVTVQDNGTGIALEHQQSMFSILERLSRADFSSGTGIGLAIAKQGLERMGGRLGVESQLGQGSSFWVELPEASKSQIAGRQQAPKQELS